MRLAYHMEHNAVSVTGRYAEFSARIEEMESIPSLYPQLFRSIIRSFSTGSM
jgi:hypothetical protein